MRYRSMTARFTSPCRGCDSPIVPGQLMVTGGPGRNYHQDCQGRTRVVTFYFPGSGETAHQNARGRCEDAPCCGCCS